MANLTRIILVLSVVFITVSCARLELDNANLGTQISMNEANEPVKKHFVEKRWNHYFVFQLLPTEKANLERMISEHVEPGDKVANLKVKKHMNFWNGLICALVAPIYCPDTLIVEGDVVAGSSAE